MGILPQPPPLLTWTQQLCFPAQLPSSASTHLSILWIPTLVFLTHVLSVMFTTTLPRMCKRPCKTTRTLQTLLPFLVWMSLMRRTSSPCPARKLSKFLSQPFEVAEVFTGSPGRYVEVDDTWVAFQAVLDGKHDDLPEGAFYMVGGIDEVQSKAIKLSEMA